MQGPLSWPADLVLKDEGVAKPSKAKSSGTKAKPAKPSKGASGAKGKPSGAKAGAAKGASASKSVNAPKSKSVSNTSSQKPVSGSAKKPAPGAKPSILKQTAQPPAKSVSVKVGTDSAKSSAKSSAKTGAKPAPAKLPPAKSEAAKPGAKPAPPTAGKVVVTSKLVPTKGAAAKPATVKPVTLKPVTLKPVTGKPVAGKAAEAAKPVATADAAGGDVKKPGPKGITIVTSKPMKKPKPKKLEMPVVEPLFKPGQKWKPLIASGPKAPLSSGIPGIPLTEDEFKIDPKAKLPKKELERYREILLRKRAELLGDIVNMEDEALRQNSGSLSNLPQHTAEQGSETFDQTLSLELAQVDRNLIKKIDEALKRIDEGTYGVCERTGQRISAERLAELPWTRYSIEAAREVERRPYLE